MKYGYSGLLDRKSPSKNKDAQSKASIEIARVRDIILDSSHPKFKQLGEWNALGIIEFEFLDKRLPSANNFAKPFNSNIKFFPLKTEFVYIISFPNINLEDNPYSLSNYYIDVLNIWNHPHHNGYPSSANTLPSTQNKNYIQTQLGNPKIINNQITEINFGKTFKEKSNINPLLPFEGDLIQEGRWGNSIRLGSTIKNQNLWSNSGENGDPILILRNGQGLESSEGWVPITEDINKDNSSIYITSTQNIPIDVSSTDYISYSEEQPVSPKQYSGAQIILNSGRLLFNSKDDHILLSSGKSINLNSKESVNIDTKEVAIQSNNIYLGNKDLADEPLLLGNITVDFLGTLLDSIEQLASALKEAETTPAIQGSPSTLPNVSLAAVSLSTNITSLRKQLNTLTSKRNFTL